MTWATKGMAPQGRRDASEDDFSDDDEGSPLAQDTYGGSARTSLDTKQWDVFRNPPPKTDSGSMENQKCLDFTVKILKVFAYLITFIIVLGAGVVAKGTLLFMTSQVKQSHTVAVCNSDLTRDKSYLAKLPFVERSAWIWVLIFSFMVPELGTLIRSLRICFFKSSSKPQFTHLLFVLVMESFHTVGVALLVFVVLPDIDVVRGAMLTNCVCFVPGVLNILTRGNDQFLKTVVDCLAVCAQISGFLIWPLLEPQYWTIPVTIFLISFGWWENYVTYYTKPRFMKTLAAIKEDLKRKTRYTTYRIVSIWKMILFFGCTIAILQLQGENLSDFFTNFVEGFQKHSIFANERRYVSSGALPDRFDILQTGDVEAIDAVYNAALWVFLIHFLCAYFCYIFAKFACKILIQGFSYAFPVNLTIPVTISILIALCGIRESNPCAFHNVIPDYLFFEAPDTQFENFITTKHVWIWLLWLLSQTWITLHIWTPKCERLATTEKIFVTPMYSSFLIDQSLGMNRRKDDEADVKTEDLAEIEKGEEHYETISVTTDGGVAATKSIIKSSDHITRIYACATMWHETKDEMMEMLKSIMRMDEDQCARRVAQKYLRVVDQNYYEFETHIFFDDAFELEDEIDENIIVNRFVKLLVSTMDEAAQSVHETNMIRIKPPKKYPAPYGGRLEWTLPGKTRMIAHLKDKSKIRHRKRWSQVMYMYYLLGHKLMEQTIPVERKDVIADNTYLLTLDGDIDFQPNAVQLLVDLMKKNRNLGAACGRIHPVGSGPMVWYQKFEYAIGHWLQKATEHMIGCVLCSPGCFSLFRGKALMDDNVMKKYTTKSEEARHYVQYDQGEDRWLCTLLLQRGYRVEYSAASDAYTHCPESFNEFYTQRRRWVPSTMANIMDLLMDARRTIKVNDNISLPYIAYQIMLMGGTILGPGTIFLMLVGAFVAAFKIDNWTSFYYNIIPILIFMVVCFLCSGPIQLFVAAVITGLYTVVMMAVLVGLLIQIQQDGPFAPSTIFLFICAMEFVVAAILHPQEFGCLPCGAIYYVIIPSMYLLLIIYSVCNLHIVTWGTREVQSKRTKAELEQEKKEAEEAKKKAKQKSLLGFLQSSDKKNKEEGSLELSFAGLFKCMFCTHQKPIDEQQQWISIANTLDNVQKKLDSIERVVDPHSVSIGRRRTTSAGSREPHALHIHHEAAEEERTPDDETETVSTEPRQERDDLMNPYWIEDKSLKKGEVDFLSSNEVAFWKEMIDKYLHPIDEDRNEKAKLSKELRDLRDKSVMAFFMLNALFVTIVFLLQLNKDTLHIDWPLGIKLNITYDDSSQEVLISKEYLQLEPIGLVFVFFFALILVIQFTAMLFHRFGTLSHILASTSLNWHCGRKGEEISSDDILQKDGVNIVKKLQRLRGVNEDDDDTGSANDVERRKTILNLEKNRKNTRTIGTLDVAFKKRFLQIRDSESATPILGRGTKRETLKALEVRRNTVMNDKSKMETLNGSKYGIPASINGRSQRNSIVDGHYNRGYDNSEDELDNRNDMRLRSVGGRSSIVSWQPDGRHNGLAGL